LQVIAKYGIKYTKNCSNEQMRIDLFVQNWGTQDLIIKRLAFVKTEFITTKISAECPTACGGDESALVSPKGWTKSFFYDIIKAWDYKEQAMLYTKSSIILSGFPSIAIES